MRYTRAEVGNSIENPVRAAAQRSWSCNSNGVMTLIGWLYFLLTPVLKPLVPARPNNWLKLTRRDALGMQGKTKWSAFPFEAVQLNFFR